MDKNQRSKLMARIKGRDTEVELIARRALHGLGFRYRLHRRDLPGKPDLTFAQSKKAVFINGCFWHGHRCASGQNKPKSNLGYWLPKLHNNCVRDRRNYRTLRSLGWKIMVVWECEIVRRRNWLEKTVRFLKGIEHRL